jgi:hypothetical protein
LKISSTECRHNIVVAQIIKQMVCNEITRQVLLDMKEVLEGKHEDQTEHDGDGVPGRMILQSIRGASTSIYDLLATFNTLNTRLILTSNNR